MKTNAVILFLLVWSLAAPALPRSPYDQRCLDELVQRLLSDESHHIPYYVSTVERERPSVWLLSQSQNVVDRPHDIEVFKRDMLEGRFRYESAEGRIGGHYHERRRIFFVGEGHHRLAAALEIARENGDWRPFRQLVRYGLWEKTDRLPQIRHRLPVRSDWSNYLTWRRFLAPLTPHP